MIAYNNGTLRTDFKNIYYNNGTLRDVKQVWWNINGTPKLVWPDGVYTDHRDWFNGGNMCTDTYNNVHVYPSNANEKGWVGANDFSFHTQDYGGTDENDNFSWGTVRSWFLTKEKVNMSLYNSLTVTVMYRTFQKTTNHNYGQLYINFITSDQNTLWTTPNWDTSQVKKSIQVLYDWAVDDYITKTITIDVSGITDTVYIGFLMAGYRWSSVWSGRDGGEGKFTQIQLKR